MIRSRPTQSHKNKMLPLVPKTIANHLTSRHVNYQEKLQEEYHAGFSRNYFRIQLTSYSRHNNIDNNYITLQLKVRKTAKKLSLAEFQKYDKIVHTIVEPKKEDCEYNTKALNW